MSDPIHSYGSHSVIDRNTSGSAYLILYNMDPIHSYGKLLYDITKYSRISYLTLQNDSHTPCDTVSSILNTRIPEAIALAKQGTPPMI